MYNLTFRVRGLALQFDARGNVNMDYDLKLWVWRDLKPELRTVGAFNGRLKVWHSQMSWHTPGNQVSTRWHGPNCTAAFPSAPYELWLCWGGGVRWGSTPKTGRAHSAQHSLSPKAFVAAARVPVLPAVRGGPGAPCEGLPLLLL